jgi:ribosomal protein S18 acetylase RimI-like enzyme
MPSTRIRAATAADVPALVGLICELADFEHLRDRVEITPERLHTHLFGAQAAAHCVVVQPTAGAADEADAGAPVGFALYFTNFSTFLGKPGLYLEDLYVQPAWRGHGIGRALLVHLAQQAMARDCGRFEWCVLDWNVGAIGFYERMGAQVLPDWRICRVTGPALAALAAQPHSRT